MTLLRPCRRTECVWDAPYGWRRNTIKVGIAASSSESAVALLDDPVIASAFPDLQLKDFHDQFSDMTLLLRHNKDTHCVSVSQSAPPNEQLSTSNLNSKSSVFYTPADIQRQRYPAKLVSVVSSAIGSTITGHTIMSIMAPDRSTPNRSLELFFMVNL